MSDMTTSGHIFNCIWLSCDLIADLITRLTAVNLEKNFHHLSHHSPSFLTFSSSYHLSVKMTSYLTATQILPPTSHMTGLSYDLLAGDWPLLGQAERASLKIMERIKNEGSGISLTSNLEYLSLGYFLIDTELLCPHPTQRRVSQDHVGSLVEEFERFGVQLVEHPGVVIGLGDGWYEMKKTKPKHVRIASSSPHLNRLRNPDISDQFIGQVIRGGHRTEAIKRYTKKYDNIHQSLWYYNVLIPCKVFFLYLFLKVIYPYNIFIF